MQKNLLQPLPALASPLLFFSVFFASAPLFLFSFGAFLSASASPFFFSNTSLFLFFRPVALFFQPKILFQPKTFFSPKISPCLWFSASFFSSFLFVSAFFLFPGSIFGAYFCFCLALLFVSFLPAFLFFSVHVLPFFLAQKHFFQPKTILSSAQNNFFLLCVPPSLLFE